MSVEAGLLEAIRQKPDDDSVRLVYADWLDDQGEASRAEFIRVQCELTTMDRSDPRFRKLSDRSAELQEQFQSQYAPLETDGIKILRWERGFPVEISINAEIQRPEWLARRVRPEYERVTPERLRAAFEGICGAAPITSLKFIGHLSEEQLRALQESPACRNIRSLTVYDSTLADTPCLNSDNFSNIQSINLLLNVVSEDTTNALNSIAANPHLRNLKTLDCSLHTVNENVGRANSFGRAHCLAMEAVAGSPNLPALETIKLNWDRFLPRDLARIERLMERRAEAAAMQRIGQNSRGNPRIANIPPNPHIPD